MGALINSYVDANKEPNGLPSSARLYAGWLLMFTIAVQFFVVAAIVWKLVRLDPWVTNAPALTGYYVGLLKVLLMWSILFDVATALSLYGINVWKYVAALRTGMSASDFDSPTSNDSSSIPSTRNGSLSDTPEQALQHVVAPEVTREDSSDAQPDDSQVASDPEGDRT